MKRIFSPSVAALAAGLGLRLYFIFKHPAGSGDTPLYEQMATNWLQHHIYAMNVEGGIVPVDLRMPGYPAVLALIYAITGRVGENARFTVMLVQAAVDLGTCLLTASLAAVVVSLTRWGESWRRVFLVTLWIAALCPFTANYVAVPLTEVFAGFFTAAALLVMAGMIWYAGGDRTILFLGKWTALHAWSILTFLAGLMIGLGTLFRPETPILLAVAWVMVALVGCKQRRYSFFVKTAALSAIGCILPLAPWAIRNALTLHEVQFLAPKNSNLPGELVPSGFMAWERTWLFRVKDNYLVPWKLNGETIYLEDLPSRAFDSPEEKDRVAAILEQYNNDDTLNAAEDAAFGQLARERTARHPLRTYLWLPAARAFTIWFTPRIELLPFSGNLLPVKASWQDDPIDFSFTLGFFLLNAAYVGLALWGAWRLWRENSVLRVLVALFAGYIVLRTAFLTTLETPEPRYVLVCFPAVLALVGLAFAGSSRPAQPPA